jgi:lysyl-tRNA synthetase class 1
VDNEAKLVKSKGLYEYVNLLNLPKKSSTHVNYRVLVEYCKFFKDNRLERVSSQLIDDGIKVDEYVENLIRLGGNYSDDIKETKVPAAELGNVTASAKDALKQLVKLLEENVEIEDLQNSIYSIAKENQIQPKDFFKILYQIILSTNRGPKIGPFIEDIGKKKVADIISKHV